MTSSPDAMQGKVCLVTGATRGLGRAAAVGLAHMGASVVIVGRDPQRIQQTLTDIRQETGNSRAEGLLADLSSLDDTRRVAVEFLSRYAQLDVLINNVGATLLRYQTSRDGFEMTWALNYLNHFLLTSLLLGVLKSTAAERGEARIVEVTSNFYRLSDASFKQLQMEPGYNGILSYAQTKRAMIMYAVELTRRMQGTGVTINAVTPGAVRTDIAGDNGWLAALMMRIINHFALTPEEGVKRILHLAVSPELRGVSGKYFRKGRALPDDPSCHDPEAINRLWQMSERMTCLS